MAFVEEDPAHEGGRIRIVDIATGETRVAGRGDVVDWLDDDTLLVATHGA